MKGVIVSYKSDKGYGFIRSKNHKGNIFFHIKNISNSNSIAVGQEVKFDIKNTNKGLNAENIIAGKMQKSPQKIYGFLSLIIAIIITLILFIKHINIISSYIIAINIVTFFLYGYDKHIAGSNQLRVPEQILHWLAFAGGSFSALLAQKIFRHKTQKDKFQSDFWLIVIVQIVIIIIWFIFQK